MAVGTTRAILAVGVLGSVGAGTPGAATETHARATQTIACQSQGTERQHCAADTSHGVVLVRTLSETACLLGKTWGYDDGGVWVIGGCGGEFLVAPAAAPEAQPEPTPPAEPAPAPPEETKKGPEHIPNLGFKIYEGENGQIYMRLFSYARYLNQESLDDSYTDFFGNVIPVDVREDVQLTKFFLPFSGWFLTPKMRYYLYVWSANTAQGQDAQTVGAGNISYTFNKHVTFGAGITSLPSTRSTEGQFPYWLGVDDRIISDEFFRGSYTSGLWLKGSIFDGLNYMAMIANNLSTLGVAASQLDAGFNTTSLMINWLPTTHEFGPIGAFGDFEGHQEFATRIGAHYTTSIEDKQSQPGTDAIENTQLRLTDGSNIFTDELFGPGINVERATYSMFSVDGGVKYKGFSLEGEYYWRTLDDFGGTNVSGLAGIDDHGYQIQSSAMILPQDLQVYVSGGEIRGKFGNGSEIRAGLNWFFRQRRGLRVNVEWMLLDDCPVGYTAVPYPVGGNGSVYHAAFELNF
jgi:DUF3011 family protein